MKNIKNLLLCGLMFSFFGVGSVFSDTLPKIEATTTYAPNVPPSIERNYPAHVVVKFTTMEVVKELAKGVKYQFWTYDGSVPGKFVRVREGDTVEFHLLNNKSNKLPHNIDLHAVT